MMIQFNAALTSPVVALMAPANAGMFSTISPITLAKMEITNRVLGESSSSIHLYLLFVISVTCRNHLYCPFSLSNVQCCMQKKPHWELKRQLDEMDCYGSHRSSYFCSRDFMRMMNSWRTTASSPGNTLPDHPTISFGDNPIAANPIPANPIPANPISAPVIAPVNVASAPISPQPPIAPAFAPINPEPAGIPSTLNSNPGAPDPGAGSSSTLGGPLSVGYTGNQGIGEDGTSLGSVNGFNGGEGIRSSGYTANARHTADPSWYTSGLRIGLNSPGSALKSISNGNFNQILRSGFNVKFPLKRRSTSSPL